VATNKSEKGRGERLAERLRQYPELRAKVEELLDVMDNRSGEANKADDAEDLIWEQMRQIGQRAMQGWAERKQERLVGETDSRKGLSRKEKKGSTGTQRSDGSR